MALSFVLYVTPVQLVIYYRTSILQHYCLGAPLARLEAQIGIATLVRRFPNLRLTDEPLEYRRIPSFRGVVKLGVSA